eukprot:833847-Ditylum_brightwellii.AAC.1
MALVANVGNVLWNTRGLTKKKAAKIQRLGKDSAMDDVLAKAKACWGEKLKTFDKEGKSNGGNANSGSKSKQWNAHRDFKADEFLKSKHVDFQPFLEEWCIT